MQLAFSHNQKPIKRKKIRREEAGEPETRGAGMGRRKTKSSRTCGLL